MIKINNFISVSGFVFALSLICLTFTYICIKAFYTPYELARIENYRKESYIKEKLCDSDVIGDEFQLNAVTYDGRTSNCTQASIFTSTSIFIGTILDMWEDSLPRYVIYGGNWKIQALYMTAFIIISIMFAKKVAEVTVSLPLMIKLLQGDTHNQDQTFLSAPLKVHANGRRPIAIISKNTPKSIESSKKETN